MNIDIAKLRSIFEQAVETPPADWPGLLEGACAGDAELRREVEKLLEAHASGGSVLDNGPLPTTDQSRERVGGQIGPYKLLEQIGEGGMGTVWMAQQTAPVRRLVALKLIKAGMDSQQVIARFEAERQAISLTDHPNIAKVLDAGTTSSGRPYFVMELINGQPITQYCDQQHLTPRERIQLLLPVCQAIQHAHQKGIIHRDIKPSNILVAEYDDRPVPKIIDFGVAKAMGSAFTDRTMVTGFGQLVGTLEYMSPEQAKLNQLDIDTRSDIYSLGVLLYELLTGSTPFDKQRLRSAAFDEVLRIIREEEPEKPSTRLSSVSSAHEQLTRSNEAGTVSPTLASIAAVRGTEPAKLTKLVRGDLDWIVMKALDKDRSRRYDTASALARDLERFLADEAVEACPPTMGYRARKFLRKHQRSVLAGAGLLAVLVLGILGTSWGMWRESRAKGLAMREAQLKQEALVAKQNALQDLEVSEREKSVKLFESLVAQADANRLSGRPGQRFESLAILQQATAMADSLDLPSEQIHKLRNTAIGVVGALDMHLAGQTHPWPDDGFALDFVEDHSIYARTNRQGVCSIRQMADDKQLFELPGLGGPAIPTLRDDGKLVAVRHLNREQTRFLELHLWRLDGAEPRQILDEASARSIRFSGQEAAVAYDDGAIVFFELPGGERLRRLEPTELVREISIAVNPAEPIVAVASYFRPVIELRNAHTGEILSSWPQPQRPTSLDWHPNGRLLAVGCGEGGFIRLLDRQTGELVRLLEMGQGGAEVTFNQAGDRIASTGWNANVELCDATTGELLWTVPRTTAARRFSKDDQLLAGGIIDGRLGIWEVGDGREHRTLIQRDLPHLGIYGHSAVSPDHRWLAAITSGGVVVWDLGTGQEVACLSREQLNIRVEFDAASSLLLLTREGITRWPIARQQGLATRFTIGPPERLLAPLGGQVGHDMDFSGRVFVKSNRRLPGELDVAGGWVLNLDRPEHPVRVAAGIDVTFISISPDARFVVTVVQHSGMAAVWDARDGRLIKQFPAQEKGYKARFSRDGQWLATAIDGGRLVRTRDWELGPKIAGCHAFSHDSRLVTALTTTGVRLVEISTGREIALFENPNLQRPLGAFLTPDATRLIVYCEQGVHVWDLRLVRHQLQSLDLDWDWPESPPPEKSNSAPVPLTMEVLLPPSEPPAEKPAEPKAAEGAPESTQP